MQLRWEKPLHATGKAAVADYYFNAGESVLDAMTFRYLVRRSSPRSRKFVALRSGETFARSYYDSFDEAKQACEIDADSPKSTLKNGKIAEIGSSTIYRLPA